MGGQAFTPSDQSARYEIKVRGRLQGGHWEDWFTGMKVTSEAGGITVLCGVLADQSALYGLLARLRDLALPLLSVERLDDASA